MAPRARPQRPQRSPTPPPSRAAASPPSTWRRHQRRGWRCCKYSRARPPVCGRHAGTACSAGQRAVACGSSSRGAWWCCWCCCCSRVRAAGATLVAMVACRLHRRRAPAAAPSPPAATPAATRRRHGSTRRAQRATQQQQQQQRRKLWRLAHKSQRGFGVRRGQLKRRGRERGSERGSERARERAKVQCPRAEDHTGGTLRRPTEGSAGSSDGRGAAQRLATTARHCCTTQRPSRLPGAHARPKAVCGWCWGACAWHHAPYGGGVHGGHRERRGGRSAGRVARAAR